MSGDYFNIEWGNCYQEECNNPQLHYHCPVNGCDFIFYKKHIVNYDDVFEDICCLEYHVHCRLCNRTTFHLHCKVDDCNREDLHVHCPVDGCYLTKPHIHCSHCQEIIKKHSTCRNLPHLADSLFHPHNYCDHCNQCFNEYHQHCEYIYPDDKQCSQFKKHRH